MYFSRPLVASLLLWPSLLLAAPKQPRWQIIPTQFPTHSQVIAGYNVIDFGAKPDGQTDCTTAFQKALDQMSAAGGGTVFVPQGQYAFTGPLDIPSAVTLHGDWCEPTSADPHVRGTILMPLAGKGSTDGPPFITVSPSGGIKNLNIWYPDQSSTAPTPYPFCLVQKGGNNATFENLTLVNPYQGIRIGPGSNELHVIRNVFGTPLKIGIQYDSTTDIGRIERVRFSPRWWTQSGLPNAPHQLDWIKTNGTAIHMLRSDWEYVAHVEIEGYARGYLITQGVRGSSNAQFYKLTIRDCLVALEMEKTNPFGMAFANCTFEGIECGVSISEKFDAATLFSNCVFSGQNALDCKGNGNVLMQQCTITSGDLVFERGAHSLLGSTWLSTTSEILVQPNVIGLTLMGNRYASGHTPLKNNATPNTVHQSNAPVTLSPVPDYPTIHLNKKHRPSRVSLTVIPASGHNDTAAIQKALNETHQQGGGTVFLPSRDYQIKGQLNIPSGVYLRGVHDVPHHSSAGGSVLHVYPPNDGPTITMQANSCLMGLSLNHPEQTIENVKPLPFLIQGRGNDLSIINVNAVNPTHFIDLMSYRCDRHFVDYASGSPLIQGIAVGGGSENGVIQNMQFNPHYWNRAPAGGPFYGNRVKGGIFSGSGKALWEYQKENLDALIIGHTKGQFLYQNFVYGSLYGIHFTNQADQGALNCISHGHGTDGSKVGCYFEHSAGEIHLVNNELVAMSSQNKTAIKLAPSFHSSAILTNTMVWGSPDRITDVSNGQLRLQNIHSNRHGAGILVSGGHLDAFNLSFNQPKLSITATPPGQAEFVGIISRGPPVITPPAPSVKTRGGIIRQ